MRRLVHMLSLVLAVVVALPRVAAAWQQEAVAPAAQAGATALDAAGRIPADADLVLVIENATELGKTAMAAAAASLFAIDGPLSGSRQAWQALAKQLGWTEEEAFDRLLGRRVVLVARGIDNAETARWVLLSQVSMETDQRLKQKLKAAPRGIAKGQQMLAIENGQYELTSHRQAGKWKQGVGDEREVTVLLAPTGRSELLDGMLGQLVGGEAPARLLRDESVFAEAKRLGSPEILLMARLGARTDEPALVGRAAGVWPDFLVLSARRAAADGDRGDGGASRWVANVAIRERARQQQLLAAGKSSDAVFNALSPSSLLMVVQMAPLKSIFGRSLPFDDPLTSLPWPPRAAELFTGKQIIRVHSAQGADPAETPGLACTLAMEATDGEALASILDPSIGMFFSEVERKAGQRNDTTPPFPNFAGFSPLAPRILSIELGSAAPLVGVTGSGFSAAWAFPASAEPAKSWWTLAMAGAGEGAARASSAVREAGAAVGAGGMGGGEAEQRRWIWLMSSRPRELEALFSPGVPDVRGIRTFMRRVSEAGCRLSITENGDIQGEVTLRLVEEQGR